MVITESVVFGSFLPKWHLYVTLCSFLPNWALGTMYFAVIDEPG
jgi:hypothetical protein